MFAGDEEQTETQPRNTTHHIHSAHSLFPSCLCSAVIQIINLLDDAAVSPDGNAVYEVAYQVSMHLRQKITKKGKLIPKHVEISGGKVHTSTWKLNRDISVITYVFLDQKRVNLCEHTAKMAPREWF